VTFRVYVTIADMQSSNVNKSTSGRTADDPHNPSTSTSSRYGEKQQMSNTFVK